MYVCMYHFARPCTGAKYCYEYVCLSVCRSARMLENHTAQLHRLVHADCGCAWLAAFWRRCDTLCTSGFEDDVTYSHSGPLALEHGKHSDRDSHRVLLNDKHQQLVIVSCSPGGEVCNLRFLSSTGNLQRQNFVKIYAIFYGPVFLQA